MRTLFNWLLCHSVILVLLIFILTGVLFRAEIFGLDPSTEIVQLQQDNSAVGKSEPDSSSSSALPAALKAIVEPERPVEKPEFPAIPEDRDKIPQKTAQTKTKPKSVNNVSSVSASPGKIQNPPVFRPRETTTPEVPDRVDVDELLQQARRAYWNDDLQTAENLYRQFISLRPDDPDGYGELGNLLSTLGNLPAAARVYQKAADLLVKQGKYEQAEQLNAVLSSIAEIQQIP